MDHDLRLRLAAFNWLEEMTAVHGDVLPRPLLATGFEYGGHRIPLVSPQGIFKPRIMELPLSITTTPGGPYDDGFTADGALIYRYRGSDPGHRDNVGLHKVFERGRPLVYFHGVVPGRYLAVWPVFIFRDDPGALAFSVHVDEPGAVDRAIQLSGTASQLAEDVGARRAYLTTMVRQRLHQRGFRERVLAAYRSQCAFCRLRHRELLDAAHIIPDRLAESRPTVDNGISLCKLHHAAFDSFMLGVSPDYMIYVRPDVLAEDDGPVLQHGLQNLHKVRLLLPSSRHQWPDPDALAWRFERFART